MIEGEPRTIAFPEKACKAFKSELQRLEQLMYESIGIPSNCISVGKSLSEITRGDDTRKIQKSNIGGINYE